jgi:hypothetical protein
VELKDWSQTYIPDEPGIYAFHRDGGWWYVGEAQSLRRRLRHHNVAVPGDLVAWITTPGRDKAWRILAEAFYVGMLQPKRTGTERHQGD